MRARDNVHRGFGGQCTRGDVAPYVFVPGSKKRVRDFAEHWEDAREVADHYEFLIMTGRLTGRLVSACSTGIGGMSVSLAIEELAYLGADTFLRVGVTGPLVDELEPDQLVIATGAVRWDGTSDDYVRPEYPALAHVEVVMAGIRAAMRLQQSYKVGVIGDMASLGTNTTDGLRRHLTRRTGPMRQALYDAGVIDGTGEAATLLVQSSIYGLRSGVMNINSVDSSTGRYNPDADKAAVVVGTEAMRILMDWDQKKAATGTAYMVPAIRSWGDKANG